MKRYSLALAITALTLFAGNVTIAQDQKEKDKEKDKKEKLDQYEELIIRKKSDKDEKVIIEIRDGDVWVNGKPLDEYDNDNISVRKGKSGRAITVSPFRNHGGGALSFGGDHDVYSLGGDRAFLGVSTEAVSGKAGAKVLTVGEKTAAEKAGLKKGDIITKIDQEKIETPEDVSKVIRSHKPDDKVSIFIKRDGKEQVINATLGKMGPSTFNYSTPEFTIPDMDQFRNFNFDFNENGHGMNFPGKGRLGIKAQDTEDGKGVKVLGVADESVAEKAGIQEDDVITEFDGKAVNTADELAGAATASREKASVTVKLLRNGKPQTIEIKTPKKLKTANL